MIRTMGVVVAMGLLSACGVGAEEDASIVDGTVATTAAALEQSAIEPAGKPFISPRNSDPVALPQDPVPWMEGRPGPRPITYPVPTMR